MKPDLNLENVSAVIFDLDGTLYDKSGLPLHLILADMLHINILKAERKARHVLAGCFFDTEQAYYAALYYKMSCLTKVTETGARNWCEQRYMPNMVRILKKHYRLFSWVEELMKELKGQQIKIAVLSDYGCVKERLEAIGFQLEWADLAIDAPSLGGLKPCREVFEKVLNLLGTTADNTLMVGDRDDTDGAGAAACGMRFVKII